jgi:peptidyl-tRNA hydrolase
MSEMNMRPSKLDRHHNAATVHRALATEVRGGMVTALLIGPTRMEVIVEVIVGVMAATTTLRHLQPL